MREWFSDIGATKIVAIVSIAFVICILIGSLVLLLPFGKIKYTELGSDMSASVIDSATTTENVNIVTHVDIPTQVKGIYMSSWAAGNQKFREHLFDMASTTEINAVVIDIKDYTGKISFEIDDPELQSFKATENRIPDIKEFIADLHSRGIYVIGRLSSFQDSHLINIHPEWAVKTSSGEVWKDYKGVKWLEVGAKPVWDYLAKIAIYSYEIGFDEINFDYIRFPSDGNLETIEYRWTEGRPRSEVLSEFFAYIRQEVGDRGIPISADLFGLTTSAVGDLGIGQILEDGLRYFDYVAPMVYPSHYGAGFFGIPKPAMEPYKVIKYSMDQAIRKAQVADLDPSKLRPWLQDFDLGGKYTSEMVRAQIQATYDTGLSSWMLWNAGSRYQKMALKEKGVLDNIAVIPPLPEPVSASSTEVGIATSTIQ
jgi:hypothetical protein